MLVLAIDTATPAVIAGLVELPACGAAPMVLAERIEHGARRHGEALMPAVLAACVVAGRTLAELDAVVCGVGPGPFTGLRVGMVTAAALGHALDAAVHGVCSLDAIAAAADSAGRPLLVVTDARRREVYWAAYDAGGARTAGPHVDSPAALAERLAELGPPEAAAGAAAVDHVELLGLSVIGPAAPSPAGLVGVAGSVLRAGAEPAPLRPLYLRRPDAVEPSGRKRVSVG